ncbi:MAG: hypothetical protein QMC39_02600 [Flavobacteriales bacterium]
MNLILLLFLHILHPTIESCDMSTVRANFNRGNASSELLEEHITSMEAMTCETAEPYLACAIMQRAEHSIWPPYQLKYFNLGKDRLEEYISTYPQDIEARYVRLLVQKGSPGFLGYCGNISEDATFILDNLHKSKEQEEFKEEMRNAAKENLIK